MLDALHLLTVACLFAAAWLISRSAAYVARKVLSWHDRHTEAAAATVCWESATADSREPLIPRCMLRKMPLKLIPSDPGAGGGAVSW